MDDISIGPSPKEIMLLGAIVERTMTCSCTSAVDDGAFMIREKKTKSRLPPHLEKSWDQQIAWDDESTVNTESFSEQNSMQAGESPVETSSIAAGEDDKEPAPTFVSMAAPPSPSKKITKKTKAIRRKTRAKVFSKNDEKVLEFKSSTRGNETVVEFSADAAARKKKVGVFARNVIQSVNDEESAGFEVEYVTGERIEL